MIDASRFFARGRATLLWRDDADQPTAFVSTPAGSFTVKLRDAPLRHDVTTALRRPVKKEMAHVGSGARR